MLQAIGATIIIKPIYQERKGKILLPRYSPEYKKYHGRIYGKVISIGPKSIWKNDLKPGDLVDWQRHEGFKIEYQREIYFKVRDRWVMGIMKP